MNIGNDAMRLKKKLSDDLSSEHPIVSGERTEISKTNSPSNHYKESHIMHNPNAKREQSNNEPAFQIDQVVFQNKGSNPDDKTNPALDNSRVVYHVSQKPTEFDNIEVIFRFSDSEKIGYDFNSVINACPLIIEKINRTQNQPNVIIDMPDWVAPTDLLEFFFFYKNGIGHDFSIHISKLLLISDFFKNDALVDTLISKIIVPQLNLSSGIVFLEESFQRLNQQTEVSNSWFDLFFFCIETVSKNLMFYISNSEYSRTLLNLNIKVLEEIVEKYFYCVSTYNHIFHDEIHLYNATEPFNDYSEENLEYVFALLLKKRNLNDLIQLSISEYLNLSSKDIVTETSKLPKPSFFISIDGDFLNFYKESSLYITNSKQILSLIVYYRKADDSLNVSVKINENVKSSKYLILKAFTMLFTMNCNDDPERQSFSVLNLIYKVNYPLFSIKKFKQYFDRSRGESVNLKINLKFCHTHSAMITYMIRNFNKFSDNQLVPKLPKNLVANFIKHPLIKGKDDNNSLKFVINWMKSPMNQHEDMTEILNNIEWSNVNSELSFEFIIKFAYLLDRDEAFESKLRESIVNNVLTNFKKHSNHEIVESLVELLIYSSKKVASENISGDANLQERLDSSQQQKTVHIDSGAVDNSLIKIAPENRNDLSTDKTKRTNMHKTSELKRILQKSIECIANKREPESKNYNEERCDLGSVNSNYLHQRPRSSSISKNTKNSSNHLYLNTITNHSIKMKSTTHSKVKSQEKPKKISLITIPNSNNGSRSKLVKQNKKLVRNKIPTKFTNLSNLNNMTINYHYGSLYNTHVEIKGERSPIDIDNLINSNKELSNLIGKVNTKSNIQGSNNAQAKFGKQNPQYDILNKVKRAKYQNNK